MLRYLVVMCMFFLAASFAAGQSCTNCATCCCPGQGDCEETRPNRGVTQAEVVAHRPSSWTRRDTAST